MKLDITIIIIASLNFHENVENLSSAEDMISALRVKCITGGA